jgi:putative heme iron utilization protein
MQDRGTTDVLGAARVTLIGEAAPLPESDLAEARELYLSAYPNAKYWVDYDDFAFYRMSITDTYFVGGFGVMGWVTADDYSQASPDPLADAAEGIIRHMNDDHPDALALLARVHANIEASEARMTAVDRLGFHVRLTTAEGMRGTRIAFTREAVNKRQVREVFVDMVKEAR